MKRERDTDVLLDVKHLNLLLENASTFTTNDSLPMFNFVDHHARMNATDEVRFFLKKDDAENYSSQKGHLPMFSIDKFSGKNDR